MVLLDLLIPRVLSVTRCTASACRVSYDIISHSASCTMDDIIKSRNNEIKDLDVDAIDADINSKFKLLHIMAIEYSQAVARQVCFYPVLLSVLVNLQFSKIYFVINKMCKSSLETYVTLYSHVLHQQLQRVLNASASF